MANVDILLLLVLVKARQNLEYTTKTGDYKASRCIQHRRATIASKDDRRNC